jgi:hypothetical protein
MTKIVSLRVEFAVDDDVTLAVAKPVLAAILAEQATQHVRVDEGETARIHWGTAEIRQGPEQRPPGRRQARRLTRLQAVGELMPEAGE